MVQNTLKGKRILKKRGQNVKKSRLFSKSLKNLLENKKTYAIITGDG